MAFARLFVHAAFATIAPDAPDLGLITDGALLAQDGRIVAVGPREEVEATCPPGVEQVDLGGGLVTPGLIDCHTHLIFGGDRAREFEMRLEGASYAEISAAGGGIVATVAATRAASEDALLATALPRLDALIAEGATTIEVKSGYGLDLATELKMLKVARRLAEVRPVEIVPTFLGAHAIPAERKGDRAAYVAEIRDHMIPAVGASGLAEAFDAFCETIAFSPAETRTLLAAAAKAGLKLKLHADQLSDLGGAALAAEFGALSADHIEYTDETAITAMAEAGTVAVLLPGAFYMLRETKKPPIAALRAKGVSIALATDCNPGTSPLTSLLLTMNMGAVLFGLTVAEAVAGVTREAARALGRGESAGTLEPGKWCDLAVWAVDRPAQLVYRMGLNPLKYRIWRGQIWKGK